MPVQGGATDAAPSSRNTGDTSNGIRDQEKNGKKSWFKLASFNVRGLTKRVKQEQLSRDMKKYGVDVVCLEETKFTDSTNKNINEYRLICTETKTKHYGNGYMVSPKWKHSIHKFWRVSDRVSVLQLQTEQSKKMKIDGNRFVSQANGEC